jgi:integrase
VAAPGTFATKGDASRYLAAAQTDLDRRAFLDPDGSHITVAEWAEEWLARPGKRPSSVKRDRQALDVFLPTFGTQYLTEVRAHDVQTAVDARARKVSPATVRRDFASLKAIFAAACDLDLIERSPTRRIKLPTVLPPERETFGPADIARLVDEVPAQYQALVLVAAVLGLRWGEAVALRVCDVDFQRATVTVAQTVEELAGHVRLVPHGKTRTSLRSMTAPRLVLEALAAHLREHRPPGLGPEDLVFVGRGNAILRRSFVRRILHPAAERAGLPSSLTFHALRHVAVSSMAEAGLPYSVTQARAGHSTARMTMEVYSHRSSAADRSAADILDRYFAEAFEEAEMVPPLYPELPDRPSADTNDQSRLAAGCPQRQP